MLHPRIALAHAIDMTARLYLREEEVLSSLEALSYHLLVIATKNRIILPEGKLLANLVILVDDLYEFLRL